MNTNNQPQATTPCSQGSTEREQATMAVLGRLALHYPIKNRTEAQWTMVMEDYLEALRPYPSDLIAKVAKSLLETCRYWPTIAEWMAAIKPRWSTQCREAMFVKQRMALPAPVVRQEEWEGLVKLSQALQEALRGKRSWESVHKMTGD